MADEISIPGYRLAMRIGINSGIVMAGNMGSEERFEYTVIGDNVNVAARLEGLNKIYGTEIMVSEATHAKIGGRLAFRELGSVKVKGKKQAIKVYELLEGERSLWVEFFEEGLRLYREGSFEEARDKFTEVLKMNPEEHASTLYVERCETFLHAPPSKEWDGVWDF